MVFGICRTRSNMENLYDNNFRKYKSNYLNTTRTITILRKKVLFQPKIQYGKYF